MSTPAAALDRLWTYAAAGQVACFCEHQNVDLLVVFGSAIDPAQVGQARDLDLAVQFAPEADDDLITLSVALVDLLRYDRIDVMDLRRAGVVAREQALAYGLPVYERNRGIYASMQMAAMLQRMDTAWLRRLRLERLTR